jgi:putative membrane protein
MDLKFMRFMTVLALIGIVTAAAAFAQSAQDFVMKATGANMFEVESSKLALDRSKNDDVKAFAQKMADDHTKTGEKMKTVLAAENLTGAAAKEMDEKHKDVMKKLQDCPADQFDKDYIDAQVKAHDEAVGLFSDYASSGDNKALKDFASETLPALKEHQEHVKELKEKMK